MKRNLLFVSVLLSYCGIAQVSYNEMSPVYNGESGITTTGTTSGTVTFSGDRAFWDVQLDVDATTIAPGLAACYWTGTEFWVARWGNDSLFTVNASGVTTDTFVVAGVTGTRAITSDGTDMYLAANTTSIYKVNKTTKTLTSTITTSVTNCRYLTYDPTLNGGAGGFWTGTWATDWTAVSMSGATLSTISAATHGMTTTYGLAYDGVSISGPYLWAFDQTAAGTGATLVQFDMSGNPTGLTHDTQSDLQTAPNTGLAGGLWISDNYSPGVNSIGGISQGVSLFVYELADLASVSEQEMETVSVYPNPVVDVLTISTDAKNIERIEIYSLNGQLIVSQNQTSNSVDVVELLSGVYLIKVYTESSVLTSRFVKK
ncbi:MAG: T9SS type A sorting domain-containing protein [Crocinitomicaceae bacterium]|nr:T9SS type A sorting domain-containing protein [Crocinitomicaceae bacterium]MBK8926163.1 T9SS type A sorting domain-containing protein [Crocinitomicaceae bacterium]